MKGKFVILSEETSTRVETDDVKMFSQVLVAIEKRYSESPTKEGLSVKVGVLDKENDRYEFITFPAENLYASIAALFFGEVTDAHTGQSSDFPAPLVTFSRLVRSHMTPMDDCPDSTIEGIIESTKRWMDAEDMVVKDGNGPS